MLTPGELAANLNQLVYTLLLVGHVKSDPDWYRPPGLTRHHSLWLVVKGRGTFTINGTHYPAEPGKIFFFVPGMTVERRTDPLEPVEYYFLRFDYAESHPGKEGWSLKTSAERPFPLQGMYTISDTPKLIYLLEQLLALKNKRGPITGMRRRIMLQELMLTVVLDFRSQLITGDTTSAIERTQDYMSWHYQEPLTLEQLAQMAGLSVSHYSRLFRKYSGYSPIDYLTNLRMDRAKELLVLSGYRLKSIANSVGYADEFYFSRIFKKIEGVSPREYAKQHRVDLGHTATPPPSGPKPPI
ncbi:hypothetical protein J31TS4_43490 [Paenibacillus sp. J31TS4]|uniref:helix-turn-helix domain-containing protein n=1 Tax=Paenibacillus sp. J31TS4 TaxID=2807195 RepID=UPI001B2D4E9A|nr:AraC family transcriptional regulator [Paenibacillus sp. J31TS4]GIP41069.1 hypothetical protein J31TS4_43490 [Paenibacillus sp. J31TS4]